MNPYERRIIHAAVQNDKYVTTRSEGEEPFRHVVIALKKEAVSCEKKGRYDRAGRGRSDRSYGYKAAAEAEPTSLHQKQKLFQRQLRKVQKNKDIFSYSSTLHLLARLQRTRSFWRQPYEDFSAKNT